MKKEIGGYFELEDFGGKEYYPNLYKVNLGRTALRWASGRPRLYKNISAGILMRVGNGSLRATWNPDQPLSVGCGVKCFASPEKTGRK